MKGAIEMVAPHYEADNASKAADALLDAIEAKANVHGETVPNVGGCAR